jgi:predicted nucleotidyltransferase
MDQQGTPMVPRDALARICHRYGVTELAIFGSGAKGQLREDSDIDLLVVFDDDARIGLVAFARLRQELSELFGRSVDLVPKDGLRPALRKRVLGESRTLYAA